MKAILEFNLPEDKEDHLIALNAQEIEPCIQEFWRWLNWEWDEGDNTSEEQKIFDKVVEKFREVMSDSNINFI